MTCLEEQRSVSGMKLQVLSGGSGERLLVLHDYESTTEWHPYLELLSGTFSVTAPSHPGFGSSQLPSDLDSVDDLAYLYLDFLRDGGPAHVLGLGFGGWLAAEMAVRATRDILSLTLVDAVGIKISDRETRDIADHFVMLPRDFLAVSWHDPEAGARIMRLPRLGELDEAELTQLLRNRQAAALFGWKPFMHNPKLLGRLRRIDVPTTLLWGASDRLVTPEYGQAFARAIPGAKLQVIPKTGHYPYLEQPERFVEAVIRSIPRQER